MEHTREISSISLSMLNPFKRLAKCSKHTCEFKSFSLSMLIKNKTSILLKCPCVTYLFKIILLQNDYITASIDYFSFSYFSKSIFKRKNRLIFIWVSCWFILDSSTLLYSIFQSELNPCTFKYCKLFLDQFYSRF